MIWRLQRLKMFLRRQHLSKGKRKQSISLSRFLSLQWNWGVAHPIRKWGVKEWCLFLTNISSSGLTRDHHRVFDDSWTH
jgi:hypothetical protein